MRARFLSSFLRDVKKLRSGTLRRAVEDAIISAEAAGSVGEIPGIKRLSGHAGFYRIRIGEHRIGLQLDGETLVFVRCLHRREVYRHFP